MSSLQSTRFEVKRKRKKWQLEFSLPFVMVIPKVKEMCQERHMFDWSIKGDRAAHNLVKEIKCPHTPHAPPRRTHPYDRCIINPAGNVARMHTRTEPALSPSRRCLAQDGTHAIAISLPIDDRRPSPRIRPVTSLAASVQSSQMLLPEMDVQPRRRLGE